MMKKFIAATLTAALLGPNPALVLAVENATVKSVRVSADSVYIATDRPVEYKAFTTEEPPRLVLELLDSKLKTLQEIPVGGTTLRKVRTGQFQTSPVSISRVVMDLSQKTAYEITRKGTELVVMFGARPARAAAPAVKDAPAAAPQKVKIIAPESSDTKPVVMTLEPAPVKPSDVSRESAPAVIAPRRSSSASSSRSIMDSLPREPISFDYSEADVREVIDMLAVKAGINIIYGDDVSGNVTISLTKVPFDEAFKTLLSVKGLAAQQAGDNILRIASPNTLLAEQKKALPQTRVFFLSYAKAAEVKVQLEAVSSAEGRTAKYTSDEANNAVIVTDTQLGLDSTARLIRSLDRVPKQVMIEVKLVEVALDHSFDLGFNWNFTNAGGSAVGTVNLPGPTPAGSTYGGSLTFFGKISDLSYNTVIAAAVKKGKLKVLSDPKVATLNNKAATINIVDQVPYTTKESSIGSGGATVTTDKVTYVPSGITLSVTPTINSDGRIAMHLIPSVSQASGGSATTPPQTNTRSTDTNVIVKNGETIVIGGMIRDSQSEDVYKIPILGDIPLLGMLFRKKSTARKRLELLIFVTPKIMED
ncbi:MAG: AMIN domain-containing protein [Elusimicrobiales bacterium]|nr:AMIN domain-containing protein [Elusimicrobiales bacterium]